MKDRTSRAVPIDLNEVSFVLQRKGEPLYPRLDDLCEKDIEAFGDQLRTFFEIIHKRIFLSIVDRDQNIKDNYGFLDGKLFQLDPGRYLIGDLSNKKSVDYEWWAATHSFRKWIKKKHPDMVPIFDNLRDEYQCR